MAEDLLAVLSSMNVKLPPGTKATAEQLEERLAKALDSAQYINDILPKSSKEIQLKDLRLWSGAQVSAMMDRSSLNEMSGVTYAAGSNSTPAGSNAFAGLRWITQAIGRAVDMGGNLKEVAIEHDDRTAVVFLNLGEARTIDSITPAIVVRYYLDKRDVPTGKYEHYNDKPAGGIGRMLLTTPSATAQLFTKLLELNTPRVPSSHKGNQSKKKRHVKTSLVLPVGVIEPIKIGELSKDDFCRVCGKRTRQRCKHCLDAPYCSEACETEDWQKHKVTCRSLQGAEWTPFRFTIEGPLGQRFGTAISRHVPIHYSPMRNTADAAVVPPNNHGDSPFLIKLQANGSAWLMMYDRTRSIIASIAQYNQTQEPWDRLLKVIQAKGYTPGHPMYRLYCWGKRLGDYEISIALDAVPEQNLPW